MRSWKGLGSLQAFIVPIALVAGVILGIFLGWATVRVENTTPAVMREDLQEDYLRMAIDSFRVNRDPNLAVQRWDALGPAAATMFVRIQKDPRGIDPVVAVAYGQVIQAVKGTNPSAVAPEASAATPAAFPLRPLLIGGAIAVLLLVAIAIVVFVSRRGRRRPAMVSAAAQHADAAPPQESPPKSTRTDFESLGVAPPITQNMTTYVLGDDLYDESFGIDTASGDFLGEYGVGVAETIGIGEPKKVAALEIWLFDKNDIKTATKVLMSQHAFGDPGTRGRLEAKGELILVEPQRQIMLETETLQLLATVIDMQYGDGAMPERSYFERLTLELAIWRKTDRN
jgi:hypothetical protein